MSYGLAQFGIAAAGAYQTAEAAKKTKAEEQEQQEYDRGRQATIDKRAASAETRAQGAYEQNQKSASAEYDDNQALYKSAADGRGYTDTMNQSSYLESQGNTGAAANAIINGANKNSRIPFQTSLDVDEQGEPIEYIDDEGAVTYRQNILDTEDGSILSSSQTTLEELRGSYKQLQSGEEIKKAAAEVKRLRAESLQKRQDERDDYVFESNTDEGVKIRADSRDFEYGEAEAEYEHNYNIAEDNNSTANDISKGQADEAINQGVGFTVGQGGGSGTISKVISAGEGWTKYQMADGQVVTAKGDRNYRNNNVGNIEYGDFAKSNGAIGSDGRFAVFPDAETGAQAMHNLIFNAGSYKNLPLSEAIARYAPKFENDTNGYARTVLQAVGNQDKPMNRYSGQERNAIMQAMIKVEGQDNVKYSSNGGTGISVKTDKDLAASSTGNSKSGKTAVANTVQDFNVNIDKGVDNALKDAEKKYGIKSGAATTTSFSTAGTKIKEMATAKSASELSDMYSEAFAIVMKAVPKRQIKDLGETQKIALGNTILFSMMGASSAEDFRNRVYNINPDLQQKPPYSGRTDHPTPNNRTPEQAARIAAARGLQPRLTMPNRNKSEAQTAWEQPAFPDTPQRGKLSALSNTPRISANPRGTNTENLPAGSRVANDVMNANKNIDW